MTNIELQTISAVKAAAMKFTNNDIDWEQRRYELVKEIVPAMLKQYVADDTIVVNKSIELADNVISALRKKI